MSKDQIDKLIEDLIEEQELEEFVLPMKGRGFRKAKAMKARKRMILPPDEDIPGPDDAEAAPLPKKKPSRRKPMRRPPRVSKVAPDEDPLEKYTTLPIPSKFGESFGRSQERDLTPDQAAREILDWWSSAANDVYAALGNDTGLDPESLDVSGPDDVYSHPDYIGDFVGQELYDMTRRLKKDQEWREAVARKIASKFSADRRSKIYTLIAGV